MIHTLLRGYAVSYIPLIYQIQERKPIDHLRSAWPQEASRYFQLSVPHHPTAA